MIYYSLLYLIEEEWQIIRVIIPLIVKSGMITLLSSANCQERDQQGHILKVKSGVGCPWLSSVVPGCPRLSLGVSFIMSPIEGQLLFMINYRRWIMMCFLFQGFQAFFNWPIRMFTKIQSTRWILGSNTRILAKQCRVPFILTNFSRMRSKFKNLSKIAPRGKFLLIGNILHLSHATYLKNVNKCLIPAVPKLRPCHRTPGQFNESCFLTCENSRFKRGVFQRVFHRFLRPVELQKGRTVFWISNVGLWATNFDLTYL